MVKVHWGDLGQMTEGVINAFFQDGSQAQQLNTSSDAGLTVPRLRGGKDSGYLRSFKSHALSLEGPSN